MSRLNSYIVFVQLFIYLFICLLPYRFRARGSQRAEHPRHRQRSWLPASAVCRSHRLRHFRHFRLSGRSPHPPSVRPGHVHRLCHAHGHDLRPLGGRRSHLSRVHVAAGAAGPGEGAAEDDGGQQVGAVAGAGRLHSQPRHHQPLRPHNGGARMARSAFAVGHAHTGTRLEMVYNRSFVWQMTATQWHQLSCRVCGSGSRLNTNAAGAAILSSDVFPLRY